MTGHLSRFATSVVAVAMAALALSAQAETISPTDTPAETAPAKPENPGLINEIGKLFAKPSDLLPTPKPSTETTAPAASPPPSDSANPAPPPAGPKAATPQPQATKPAPANAAPPPAPVADTPAPAASSPALIPQMVRGRATCPIAPNGAPDCKIGADKLCQTKGFGSGRSLDMDSARTCSTKALLEGARTINDVCKTETFVTRAVCQ